MNKDISLVENHATFQRAVYSVKPAILARFNTLYQARDRSKLIEQFLMHKITEKEQAFVDAAVLIETDPEYASIREVSRDMDSLTAETFKNL